MPVRQNVTMAVTVEQVTGTLRVLDLTGVFANAVLGGVLTRSARLDPVGFGTLAIISGLGGGMIRDVLLQRGPPAALLDYAYVLTALAGATVAFLIPVEGRIWDRVWPLIDSLALGCWAAAGAQKTLSYGLGWLPAVLLGAVTAVGGGFARDIVLRRIPGILGGNTLYATCALAASGVMVIFYRSHLSNLGSVVATLAGAGLVLLARWQRWVLPQGDDWSAVAAARNGYNRGAHYLGTIRPHRERGHRRNGESDPRDVSEEERGRAMSEIEALSGLDQTRKWQEDFYRDLHSHPELSHQEHETARKVVARLTDFGYDVHDGIGGTGVVGILSNGDGPRVLMRADMDALPVKEDTGLPYASNITATDADGNDVPVMHACGHDVHVTCLLGAAELLANSTHLWSGNAVVLFQPAEELGDGARAMVEDKLAEVIGTPDVALAQHVLAFPSGHLGTHRGPFLSAADSMRITVHGRGAHGSMPQAAVDPVVLASMIVIRLQTIVSRELPPGEFAVLTVGSVQAGTKSNVIGDHAVIELNIRSYSTQTRETILNAVRRIVTAECQASDSPKDPTFELYDQFPLTDNDETATDRVTRAFSDYFGDKASRLPRQTASEDFSHIPTALGIPYSYWGIGGTDPDTYHAAEKAGRVAQEIPVNHSAKFAPPIQPTLDTGTKALVVAGLAWLSGSSRSRRAG